MGLGGGPSEWDEYEWFRLADVPAPAATKAGPLAEAVGKLLQDVPLWPADSGTRVLLVDLDNLRAEPTRWRARMSVVVTLARQAEHAVLAGQVGAVTRARPHLAEFAARAQAVPDGSDLADHVLLDAAADIQADAVQVVVVSNDGIFATLADRGPLTVLSPGNDALSDRLRDAASLVVDLAALEAEAKPARPTQRRVRTKAAIGAAAHSGR
jgi:hypothetical protein